MKAFALAGATDATIAIRNDVRFFADVRAQLVKMEREGEPGRGGGSDDMDSAIAQLVSEAVSADGVIDIYEIGRAHV